MEILDLNTVADGVQKNFARPHCERHVAQRPETPERLGQILHTQEVLRVHRS